MISPVSPDTASADAEASLLNVPITPPSPEILVAVQSALAEVPVPEDGPVSPERIHKTLGAV